ncbi:GNAT family N-acetyltransferase [Paenibacillus sp. WC2504]|uniref:GNAT family N-acetyltransferase n=1 Tax=Paenibacillus sp. WC2504 TaxID=3461403 RepID=UPI0040457F54
MPADPNAIRTNLLTTFDYFSTNNPLIWFKRTPTITRMESDVPFSLFNVIFDYKKSDQTDVVAEIMAITESYHERGMKCLWYTYSHDLDPAVIEALKSNGYVHTGKMAGMSLSLENGKFQIEEVPGLKIHTVHNEQEFDLFRQTFIAEYGLSEELEASVVRIFADDPDGKAEYYVAYLDDTAVGTLMTYGEGDVKGIYTVATLKAFRSRGIGSALVSRALCDMQTAGVKQAILQANAMGQRIYNKLGFKEELIIDFYSA